MKLILTHDVSGLGEAGEVVEVKDGYGRNYLLPQGYAIVWTKGGESQIEGIKRSRDAREIRDLDHAKEVRDQIEGLTVQLAVRSGENGTLFGAVTSADIAEAATAASGKPVDRRSINVATAIKSVGTYKATAKLHTDVSANLTVEVVAE